MNVYFSARWTFGIGKVRMYVPIGLWIGLGRRLRGRSGGDGSEREMETYGEGETKGARWMT